MIKISVITINFNNLIGIKRTYESVRIQTLADFEYIIIDGASTDGSKEYIESIQNTLSYWSSKPDRGIYNAMNIGLKVATGDYVLYLNSGDELCSAYVLENIKAAIFNDMQMCDCYYGNEKRIDAFSKQVKIKNVDIENKVSFLFHNSIPHQASFWRRTTLIELGGYDERFAIIGDFVLLYKALVIGKIFKKIDVLVDNFYTDGISSNPKYAYKSKRDLVIFTKNYLGNIKDEVKIILKHHQKNTSIRNKCYIRRKFHRIIRFFSFFKY
jgi:glycosyltransferase involved in cell wall biosynthesis